MSFFDQYLDEKHSGKQKNTKPKTNALKNTFSPILDIGKNAVNTVKNEAKNQLQGAGKIMLQGVEEAVKKREDERKIQAFRDAGGFAKNPKAGVPEWKNEDITESIFGTNKLTDARNNMLGKYNTADTATRVREVQMNLENGLKNDPRAKRALKNNDLKDFRSMYGYDTADKTKKMLIDTVWAKNGGKTEWEITAGNRDTKNDPKILSHEIIRREKNGEIDTPLLNKFRNAWNDYDAGKTFDSVQHKPQYKEANGILDVGTHWHNLWEEGKMTGSAVLGAGLEGLDIANRATLGTIFASDKNTAIKEYEDAKYNEERNAKIHTIRTTDWGQNEEQDTGMWGVVKQFGRMSGGNINRALAGVASHMGNKDLANFFDDNADTYLVSQMRNNSENPDTFGEKILMGGLNLAGSMVYGTAGAAVGGGKGALAGASMFGASQEYGSMKNEILLATGDNAKASEYARIYATGAGLLEGMFPASKAKALGGSANGVVSGTYKEAFLSVLKDMAKEGVTEASQEMLGNVFKYQEGLVKNYFEGVGESALLGAILGGGVGIATNTEVSQAYKQLKNDIPKALDIITKPSTEVNETMNRIARVALQEYENVAKNTEITMSDNVGRVEVQSVQYDEGKYRASARIETENKNTTIGFDEVFTTKEEAVKNAMVRASDVLPAESDIKYEIDTRLDDIYREHEIGREQEYKADKINWENVDIETTVAKLENEAKKSMKVDGYNSKDESVGINGSEHKDKGYTVYKGITKGAEKKFPLDYFAFDKNTAKQYGDTVIEKKIFPKKIADFTDANSQEKLSKIILDEYTKQYPNIEKEYFEKQIQKGFENTDSFMNPIYEMIENEGVTKKLKEEGYDSAIYWDWGKGGRKRHKTIAMLEVEDIFKKINNDEEILQKNPQIAEKKNGGKRTPSIEWKEGLDLFAKGELPSNKTISLGVAEGELAKIIGNENLTISQKRLRQKIEKHEYNIEDIKDLDKELKNPMLIYEGGNSKGRAIVVITNLGKNDQKFAIAISHNRESTPEISEIKSIHLKDIEKLLQDKNKGKIEKIYFEDNKKISSWLGSVLPEWRQPTTKKGDIENSISENKKNASENILNNGYNSTSSDGVSKAENRTGDKAVAFKLSNRIREVIEKMGTQFTRYTNVGATGTFYTKSGNIAINSVNDIDVVHHELSHQVDIQNGVTDTYKKDAEIKQMLYEIYINEYAGAIPDASEDLYMREGYAVLQEKHLMKPTEIEEKYPKLVEIFVDNGHEMQKTLNEEMGKIIADYQGLTDIEKIGAILTNGTTNKKFEDFLSVAEKVEMNVADAVLPFVKMEEQIEEKTELANTLYARNVIYGRIAANIDPNNMKWMASAKESGKEMKLKRVDQTDFWHFNDKLEMEKKVDYNWGSLIRDIGNAGKIEEFTGWLVARDQVGQYERLKKLKSWRSTLEDEAEIKKVDEKIKNMMGYLKANEKILARQLVESVHDQYKNNSKFKEWAEKFDTLLSYDVEFQKNVGILSEEHYKAIKNSYGYAPMRREVEDMILGDKQEHRTLGGYKVGKMTQVKAREGGSHSVVNPLLSAIKNHEEAIKKGYKQMVANKIYDTIKYFPRFAQEIELQVITNEKTGQKYYKTMEGKDPTMDNNIIVKMVNGEQKAIVVNSEIIKIVKTVTQGLEKGVIEKVLVGASRIFSKGTTGTYLPFFMTNLFRDQQQAIVHTRNGYKPVASQMKLLKYLYAKNTPEAKYVQEYLALENNYGSYNFSEETGENVLKYITEGDKWYKRWAGNVEKLTNATSMPAQASETITRMAEYVASRMNGKTMWQALEEAGQLTAPFHHKGMLTRNAFGRGAIGSLPFLNSILQGLAQYMRTARGPIGRRRIAAMLGANTALVFSVMTYALLTADEDERRALFDKNPEEFAKFIFLPGDIKIPIPQELGFIGATFGMMLYDVNGAGYKTGEYVDVMGSWLPDQTKVWDISKMSLSLLPQVFKPAIEVIANVQTFPSVRPLESERMLNKNSEFRYHAGSSTFAKWLGSTEFAKNLGSDGLSPIEIDHLRKGYLGRASGYWAGDETSINPFSGLKDKRFFTSDRTVKKLNEEWKKAERMTDKDNVEMLGLSDEEKIEWKARKEELSKIREKIWDYYDIEDDESEEAKNLRNEIYSATDRYFENGVEVTEIHKMRYEKAKEAEEKKSRREEIMAGAMEKYREGGEKFGKLTEIQNWAKGEFGEDKKGYEQWKKDFFMEYSYKDNASMMEAYNARNNDEKIYLLKKIRDEVGKENFKEELRVLKRNKIFSDVVIKAVSEG